MNKLARLVVVPLALVAVVACDKGKGGSAKGATGPTGAAGASAIAPAKGGLNRALAAMPKDSEAVFGLDTAQLRKSALFKKYESKLMGAIGDDLAKFKATCGFDPMEKLSGVLVGGGGKEMANATIFVRGFERAPTMECLKKHEAAQKAAGKPAVLTVDGDYVEFNDGEADAPAGLAEGADPAAAAASTKVMKMMWVDDQTALLIKQGEGLAGKDVLAAAAAAKDGEGLMSSKAFTDMLGKTRTGSALWFVMKGDSALAGPAAMVNFKAMYGSVDVDSGIAAAIRMWMNSADEAKSTAGTFNTQLDQVKSSPFGGMLGEISIKADGEDVAVSIKLSQSQLEQITKMASSMGGGF